MFVVEEEVRPPVVVADAHPDDPSGLSDAELEAAFGEVHRAWQAIEAKRLRYLAEVERRAIFRKDGYATSAAWLAGRFGMAGGAARSDVRVATALQDMPQVEAALVAGDVSISSARILLDARREQPEAFGLHEGALVEAAASVPADGLRRVVAEWSQRVDADRGVDRAERLRERRWLDLCPTASGMVRVNGELDPEGGGAVLTAVGANVDAELRSSDGSDLRTQGQRRADAFVELAHRYLGSPDRPTVAGERPNVTVTVDAAALGGGQGRRELDHAGTIGPEAVRRISCDASITRVVMAGASQPLDVGRRTQLVPYHLRRALTLRDRGCRFPTCDRPAPWSDAHHVIHWADGGITALENLVLLCRHHHRAVHEGGFGLRMDHGVPVFRRPDGSVLEDGRAPP
jgi:hypothetical protein